MEQGCNNDTKAKVIQSANRIKHRGPDWTGIYESKENIMVHERLAIVDVEHGEQPLYSADRKQILAVNGEIYNHKQLRESQLQDVDFATKSDCECIIHLYNKLINKDQSSDAKDTATKSKDVNPIDAKDVAIAKDNKLNLPNVNVRNTWFLSDVKRTQIDIKCVSLLNSLQGMFAFVMIDETTNTFFVARDHIGKYFVYSIYLFYF